MPLLRFLPMPSFTTLLMRWTSRSFLASFESKQKICRRSCSSSSTSPASMFQNTLSSTISRSGLGLHTGIRSSLKLIPAAAGEGRYFVHVSDSARRNPEENNEEVNEREEKMLPASICNVEDTTLCTSLSLGKVKIRTVEHVISALEGLGVDNCRMELEGGNEIPILDGSAKMWVEAIHEAGICFAKDKQGRLVRKELFVLKHPLSVTKGDSFIAAFPSSKLKITYGIEFEEVPAIKTQWFSFCPSDISKYEIDIAPARTFGIAEQIGKLLSAGLIKGGSMDNAIVCSEKDGWLNLPLRFSDEPCRHKLLDLIGDIGLCAKGGNPGLPIAHIVTFKGSHLLHTEFGSILSCHMNNKLVEG